MTGSKFNLMPTSHVLLLTLMAASCLSPWKLKDTVETGCSWKEFIAGVDVWIRRPHVVDRRLLGAVPRLEKPLPGLADFWNETVDLGSVAELIKRLEEHYSSQEAPGGEGAKLLVRELLPRASGVASSLELIAIGMHFLVVCCIYIAITNSSCRTNLDIGREFLNAFVDSPTDYMKLCVSFFPLKPSPNKDVSAPTDAVYSGGLAYQFIYQPNHENVENSKYDA